MVMKRFSLSMVMPAAAAVLVALFASCEINNPTKDLKVIVNTVERDNMVSVTLKDVLAGGVVTSDVNVEVAGKDAGTVTDEVNNKKTSFTAKNGFVSFAIANGTVISPSHPIRLMLKLSSEKYLAVEYPVTLTSGGRQFLYVNMVKKEEVKQAGIEQTTFVNAGSSDNAGQVTATVEVKTEKGSEITIPQGTVLKDETGAALTGKLNISTTVYYPESAELIQQEVQQKNNESYYPMMSLSVLITDQSGRTASTAGGNMFVPANASMQNPATETPYKVGDKLQIGYVDPVTGTLVFTGEIEYVGLSTRMGKTPGGRVVTSTPGWIAALTALLGDRKGQPLVAWQQAMIIKPNVTLGASFSSWSFDKVPMELVVDYLGMPGQAGTYTDTWNVNSISFALQNFECTKFTDVYLRIPGNDAIRLSNTYRLQAGANVIELKPPTNYRIYDVMVKGKCPYDKTKEIIPGGTILTVYNEAGTSILSTISLSRTGEARLYLEKAGKYKVRSTYNGKNYEADMVVDASGVPVISGSDVEVIKVDASVSPIVLQYYILTSEACD